MGRFLNSIAVYEKYKAIAASRYFVDKTALLEDLMEGLGVEPQYICITRPRRFGKTVMANMIGAFFGRREGENNVFDGLEVAAFPDYAKHLNRHDVIYIDFSEVPENCVSYRIYIERISAGVKEELAEKYPELKLDVKRGVWDILAEIFERKNGQKFIFVMDEWDAVFHMPFFTENDRKEYLLFLKALLKSKAYVEMAYMTGILPIAKYSSGSELNMFVEFRMTTMEAFSEYFGFTESEVDTLYQRYLEVQKNPKVTREGLREWYDGYYTIGGERLYNPRSVVLALQYNQMSNYWTSSGPYDEIFYYIKNDLEHIRNDLVLMAAGERIRAKIQEFSASSMELKTKNQIYSAMVVYGLLTYIDGEVFIPNKELMLKYEELLQSENSLGYVYQLAMKSEEMLKATLSADTDTMAAILEYAHDTETPILSYNSEVELAAIVNLVYLSARDRYRIEREDKAGKGYVDFIFYPVRQQEDCIILELKIDHTPEEAIEQIIEKRYALRFKGKLGERPQYTGRILGVGIGYSKENKKHFCKVEILE